MADAKVVDSTKKETENDLLKSFESKNSKKRNFESDVDKLALISAITTSCKLYDSDNDDEGSMSPNEKEKVSKYKTMLKELF